MTISSPPPCCPDTSVFFISLQLCLSLLSPAISDILATVLKMGPPLDDYTLKMRNLHKRYGLSDSALELFKAYGEHHRGIHAHDELGRRFRTSSLWKTCTDTITSLTTAMQKDPSPECITECSEIITCCSEMLNLASEFTLTLDHVFTSPLNFPNLSTLSLLFMISLRQGGGLWNSILRGTGC